MDWKLGEPQGLCEDAVTDPLEKPAGQTTQALGHPKGFGLCPRSWVAGAGELSNWCVTRGAWPLRREWMGVGGAVDSRGQLGILVHMDTVVAGTRMLVAENGWAPGRLQR